MAILCYMSIQKPPFWPDNNFAEYPLNIMDNHFIFSKEPREYLLLLLFLIIFPHSPIVTLPYPWQMKGNSHARVIVHCFQKMVHSLQLQVRVIAP